ncbi:MAG TPA: GNAT family protein [Trebonia sp.]
MPWTPSRTRCRNRWRCRRCPCWAESGCYLACGFRSEGVRREAELYPAGWQDLIIMGLLRSEYAA